MNVDQFEVIQEYFNLSSVGTSIQSLLINILVLGLMTFILSAIYTKTAKTLSNRKRLASIFPLLSIVTMMIISVIKSSLALSLGLVGALSIVRFRSAIKEPEELTYIFFAISLGLGMGADQQALTVSFFVLVCLFIVGKHILENKLSLFNYTTDQSLYLSLKVSKKQATLNDLVGVIKKHTHFIDLKRIDENETNKEFLFVIKSKDYNQLSQLKDELLAYDGKMAVSILNDEQLSA